MIASSTSSVSTWSPMRPAARSRASTVRATAPSRVLRCATCSSCRFVQMRSMSAVETTACSMIASSRSSSVASGGLDGCLELVDVLVEHGHGERESIGEVPVEAALPDARLLRHGAERRLQPVGREDLARRRDEGAAILGAGGSARGWASRVRGTSFPRSGMGVTLLPDNDVRYEGGTMTRQWDREVDVLVAGSGAAGLTAAIAAADAGLSTLVVESTDRWGGTTMRSGGGLWMPNNPVMRRLRHPGLARGGADLPGGVDRPGRRRRPGQLAGAARGVRRRGARRGRLLERLGVRWASRRTTPTTTPTGRAARSGVPSRSCRSTPAGSASGSARPASATPSRCR